MKDGFIGVDRGHGDVLYTLAEALGRLPGMQVRITPLDLQEVGALSYAQVDLCALRPLTTGLLNGP